MIYAGTDQTTNTLILGTVHVLDNRKIYRKMMDELVEAWPNIMDRPRFEDLESLPYLVRYIYVQARCHQSDMLYRKQSSKSRSDLYRVSGLQ